VSRSNIWKQGVGDGFNRNSHEAGFALGAGFGVRAITGTRAHDLALATVHYGWVFSDIAGEKHWYRGNWELLAEIFGGAQFSSRTAYVIGAAPILRYDFATGTSWVPFVDVGGGVSATDIGRPDLSTTFEFNVQGGAGWHWFWRDNAALTLQYRWLHLSNAGLKFPNLGANTSLFYAGLTWFF
jgi:lipid A 3-O-deacylase